MSVTLTAPASSPKTSDGAVLWTKSVVFGLIGSGPTRLWLVGERFGRRDGVRGVH